MQTLAPGLHVVDRPQRFLGLEIGTRMTVLQLQGGLLVHSPVDVDPQTLASLGDPRWVLAPNLMHHLYVDRWTKAGLEAWAAPGLPEKRRDLPFAGVVEPNGPSPFGKEVDLLTLSSIPFTNEVVLLHRPSRTLVVTDLLFHFPPTAPWSTRFAMRCFGAHPGCRASYLERFGMSRKTGRRELERILAWDFDRIVLTHGEVVQTGGRETLRRAYRWLGI
jgi:hypothetical protein